MVSVLVYCVRNSTASGVLKQVMSLKAPSQVFHRSLWLTISSTCLNEITGSGAGRHPDVSNVQNSSGLYVGVSLLFPGRGVTADMMGIALALALAYDKLKLDLLLQSCNSLK